jgi:heme-degrading monooxygenase HmoA
MILEVAVLDIRSGQEVQFESAFEQARPILASMPGHLSHQLLRCLEKQGRYMLMVHWRSLEDHTVGFRQSERYAEWRRLLHHFYDPFPEVEHYEWIITEPRED